MLAIGLYRCRRAEQLRDFRHSQIRVADDVELAKIVSVNQLWFVIS
jgi:hypothetical protein